MADRSLPLRILLPISLSVFAMLALDGVAKLMPVGLQISSGLHKANQLASTVADTYIAHSITLETKKASI